jgi:hypothetical protein
MFFKKGGEAKLSAAISPVMSKYTLWDLGCDVKENLSPDGHPHTAAWALGQGSKQYPSG